MQGMKGKQAHTNVLSKKKKKSEGRKGRLKSKKYKSCIQENTESLVVCCKINAMPQSVFFNQLAYEKEKKKKQVLFSL